MESSDLWGPIGMDQCTSTALPICRANLNHFRNVKGTDSLVKGVAWPSFITSMLALFLWQQWLVSGKRWVLIECRYHEPACVRVGTVILIFFPLLSSTSQAFVEKKYGGMAPKKPLFSKVPYIYNPSQKLKDAWNLFTTTSDIICVVVFLCRMRSAPILILQTGSLARYPILFVHPEV